MRVEQNADVHRKETSTVTSCLLSSSSSVYVPLESLQLNLLFNAIIIILFLFYLFGSAVYTHKHSQTNLISQGSSHMPFFLQWFYYKFRGQKCLASFRIGVFVIKLGFHNISRHKYGYNSVSFFLYIFFFQMLSCNLVWLQLRVIPVSQQLTDCICCMIWHMTLFVRFGQDGYKFIISRHKIMSV